MKKPILAILTVFSFTATPQATAVPQTVIDVSAGFAGGGIPVIGHIWVLSAILGFKSATRGAKIGTALALGTYTWYKFAEYLHETYPQNGYLNYLIASMPATISVAIAAKATKPN